MAALVCTVLMLAAVRPGHAPKSVDAASFFRSTYVTHDPGCTKSDLKEFVRNLYGGGATRIVFTGFHRSSTHSGIGAQSVSWRMPEKAKSRDYVLRLARLFVVDHIDPQARWSDLFPDAGQTTQTVSYDSGKD
jgi:hypothetical protein